MEWFNDFSHTLPNRTAHLTARLNELKSQASFEMLARFYSKTVPKMVNFVEEAFVKASVFATDAFTELRAVDMNVSEGLWKIVGVTSALIITFVVLWWGLKKLCSRR